MGILKKYPVDVTGVHPDNLVSNERHDVHPLMRVILPRAGLFYVDNLVMVHANRQLVPNTDFRYVDLHSEVTQASGKEVYARIELLDNTILGEVMLTYQCYGSQEYSRGYLNELAEELDKVRKVNFHDLLDIPSHFPPSPHRHTAGEIIKWNGMIDAVNELNQLIASQLTMGNAQVLLLVNQFQDNITRLLNNVVSDITRVREVGDNIENIRSKVDQELQRIRTQLQAMGDAASFSTLLDDKLAELKRTIDASLLELSKAYQKGDETTLGAAKQYTDNAVSGVSTTLTELSNGLDDRFVTPEELGTILDGYTPATAHRILAELVASLPTSEGVGAIVREKLASLRYSSLQGLPRTLVYQTGKTFAQLLDEGYGYHAGSMHVQLQNQSGASKYLYANSYPAKGISPSYTVRKVDNGTTVSEETTARYMMHFGSRNNINRFGNTVAGSFYTRYPNNGRPTGNVDNNTGVQNIEEASLWVPGDTYHHELTFRDVRNLKYTVITPTGRVSVDLVTANNLAELVGQLGIGPSNEDIKRIVKEYLGDLSGFNEIVRIKQALTNKVNTSSVQSTLTDFARDKLVKLFDNGVISAKTLRVGLGVTIDCTSSGILTVNGMVNASNLSLTSDRRLKQDIRPIEDGLDTITKLTGYRYKWKDGTDASGVIAQEVLDVIPEAVVGTEEEGYSVQYLTLIPYLIEAVKTLAKQNEDCLARIKELEHECQSK